MKAELILEWSVQHLCKEGEKISGDLFIVKDFSDRILVSVIDGLGHGEEAYNISNKSVKFISESTSTINNSSLNTFFLSIDRLLRGSRGAVMTSVLVNKRTGLLTWAGIGNVNGILLSSTNNSFNNYYRIVLQNGVIGFNMPEVVDKKHQLKEGDILMLFTDGISDFSYEIRDILYKLQYYSIEFMAEQIFNSHRNPDDDALFWIGKFTWNQ